MFQILIVGAGLTGSTLARMLVEHHTNIHVKIIDKRNHIAGNCYDFIDPVSNIRINQYGAHIFHTNDEAVFIFLSRFTDWIPYHHTVKAKVGKNGDTKYVSVPVNIDTVNALCDTSIQTEKEMQEWLKTYQKVYPEITNSEEMALSRVGEKLYETLFKYYTLKQWDKYPHELDPSVLSRIPVRTNFDQGYFSDSFQVLPKEGYTEMVRKMLFHPRIQISLNTDFFKMNSMVYDHIFYTGPIDHYFSHLGYPKLEYRSIEFYTEYFSDQTEYQPFVVVNYPEPDIEYTRSVEYRHFPNQFTEIQGTIVVHEKTTDDGEPYYPVPTQRNRDLYAKYQNQAEKESKVEFVGRLASYKYLNMDQAVRLAMDTANRFKNRTEPI
jgi:UDP-galactopyranose mutase